VIAVVVALRFFPVVIILIVAVLLGALRAAHFVVGRRAAWRVLLLGMRGWRPAPRQQRRVAFKMSGIDLTFIPLRGGTVGSHDSVTVVGRTQIRRGPYRPKPHRLTVMDPTGCHPEAG